MLRKGEQFMLHMWHLPCFSCDKPGDKPWMSKRPDCNYDKREHICGHLWHLYSVTVNQVIVATIKLSKWWLFLTLLATRNPWFSSFFVSSNSLSRKSWQVPRALEYRSNWDIYTPYAGAAGMLLQINGKFTMGKLK